MLKLHKNRIFKSLHSIQLIDKYIEDLKKKIYEKYYIDYLGIHLLDNSSKYLISKLGHDNWHEYYWQLNEVVQCPAILQLSKLKEKEQGVLFFQTYQKPSLYEARGEIIGNISPGSSILFSDPITGHKIQFCITFKDASSIDKLDYVLLLHLMKELHENKGILNDFMEYFTKIGNLQEEKQIENFINKF